MHLVGYSLGGWLAAEFAAFYPKRLKSLTLMVPAGLRIPGKPIPNPVAMMPDEFFDLIFNDKTNMHQVLPDFESLDEIVHLYGEGTTLARLAWNPQYDLEARAAAGARHVPVAGRARRARPPDPRRDGGALRRAAAELAHRDDPGHRPRAGRRAAGEGRRARSASFIQEVAEAR